MATEFSRILMRRKSAAEWNAINEILMEGEFGIVLGTNPVSFKIGNGLKAWSELPFVLNNEAIQAMIDALEAGQINAVIGVAPPSNIVVANVTEPGTYPLYGGLVVSSGDLSGNLVQFRKISGAWSKILTPVLAPAPIDSLTSSATNLPLSANQGRVIGLFKAESEDKSNYVIKKADVLAPITQNTLLTSVKNAQIILAAVSAATAYLVGKNFYDTFWVTGGQQTSLISQGINSIDVNVTAGNFRNVILNNKQIPSGEFTVSIELLLLSGTVNVLPSLYFYRAGQSQIVVNATYDSASGLYKAKATFTNLTQLLSHIEIQFSTGSATNATTWRLTTQIESGALNTTIVPYIGLTQAIGANSQVSIPRGVYQYIFGTGFDLKYTFYGLECANDLKTDSVTTPLSAQQGKVLGDFKDLTEYKLNSISAEKTNSLVLAGLEDISSLDAGTILKLLSTSGSTARLRGKNLYDTFWVTGGESTSLLAQGVNLIDVNVTAGVSRSVRMVTKRLPAGQVIASIEMEILTGVVNITPVLNIIRPSQTPTASGLPMTLVNGIYKVSVTVTNPVELDARLEVLFSNATATNALTVRIKTQIEIGNVATIPKVPYIGQDITLAAGVAQSIVNPGFKIAFGAGYVLSYSTISLKSGSKEITVISDSLSADPGATTGKHSSDTNVDGSWPGVLGRALGSDYKVNNMGVGGEPSWMIVGRQGGIPVKILPTTIPSEVIATKVDLRGQEANYLYDGSKWTYAPNSLRYNISTDIGKGVNPCIINGIKGNLSRVKVSSGVPDPVTGETTKSDVYEFYFTRQVAGEASTFVIEKELITFASINYNRSILITYFGTNDGEVVSGATIVQTGAIQRARRAIDLWKATNGNRFLVMSPPAGNNVSNAISDQQYGLEFGHNYINTRLMMVKYGVAIANSLGLGYSFSNSSPNAYPIGAPNNGGVPDPTYPTVGDALASGVVPRIFKRDEPHNNWIGDQVLEKIVESAGHELGYW